ncbi:MAG: hypothetical protein QOF51_532 [Chloroflexota bacterium]|jgi:demethylmenaquinone methyltransferase/2-methoxy-6-polyprenyl-1,4-benzoquinol methylase|nr:hypothetical protein [Chloroflexota bacterium]
MNQLMGNPTDQPVPAIVAAAFARAERHGFALSSEPTVGRLLATLAAATPIGGRILELGTGVGAGLAWIVHGLGTRADVQVISIEANAATAATALAASWASFVDVQIGDAETLLPMLGQFDLIFADAEGGKWSGLALTVAALQAGAVLVVDDMDLYRYADPVHRTSITRVREHLIGEARLVCVELPVSSGIIVATRRAEA